MSKTLSKVLNGVLIVLLAITGVLVVSFYSANANVNPDASFSAQIEELGSILQYYLYWMYGLAILAAASTIIFSIVTMFTSPRSAIKALIVLVILAIIVGVAYTLADDAILNLTGYNGPDNVPSRLKFAGTMLHTLYFSAALAVVTLLYSELAKMFK